MSDEIAAAREAAGLLREIAQLPPLLDGTDCDSHNVALIKATVKIAIPQAASAVVITDDLRRRLGAVLLKLEGFAVRREYQRYFAVAPEMADILRDIAQWHESVAGGDYICRHYWNDLSQRIADVLAEIDNAI